MSDGEFERIQNRVNQFYDQFKHAVMVGRGLKQEDVDSMADGTIEVGEKAIERGFADEIGSLKGVVRRLDKSKTFTTGGGQSMALFSKDKAEKRTMLIRQVQKASRRQAKWNKLGHS
jgi:ClpP class serine protease